MLICLSAKRTKCVVMTCTSECDATTPRMTGNGRLNAGAN